MKSLIFRRCPATASPRRSTVSRFAAATYAFISGRANVPNALRKQADALAAQGKTPLFFAAGNRLLGVIAVADVIKEDSPQAVRELQNMGLRVVMLTGDNERTGESHRSAGGRGSGNRRRAARTARKASSASSKSRARSPW